MKMIKNEKEYHTYIPGQRCGSVIIRVVGDKFHSFFYGVWRFLKKSVFVLFRIHTHTHTYTRAKRERERERDGQTQLRPSDVLALPQRTM